ncbi:MAG: carboxylating nicotinate-nucleotide diphosphorylase [Verrucomicrobia bacterium]|nr:carboxylating nicotinate-nucleotide diphosphorylase [Verrucomicrobiota bacterium]
MDEIKRIVRLALGEDVGSGDATSLATIPEDVTAKALMVAREPLIISGLEVAGTVFHEILPELQVRLLEKDGTRASEGAVLMEIEGSARAILTGERVALNFVQRLSGVATMTSLFVDAVRGTNAAILDTRKTTPGLRLLEKYAVACGDGKNHRIGLFDMVLIKDNHLVAVRDEKPNAIAAAVRRAREKFPDLKVEVEADTLEQFAQALDAGADIVLLDNMTLEELRAAVKQNNGRAKLEASGGVNLQTVRGIAETGVDYISVGALTHSARAMDIALDFHF